MKMLLKPVFMVLITVQMTYAAIIGVPSDQATIQEGIQAAVNGDTVLVQPDTYSENINFNGKNIVLGSLCLTTGDTSYISKTIIDGNKNGCVVVFENGEDSTCAMTGFTIRNGTGDSNYGGGVTCNEKSSPLLSHLVIKNNEVITGYGAGVRCKAYSKPIIQNCRILLNNVQGGYGGGIYCSNSANVLIKNVLISDNYAEYAGGGIECEHSRPTLVNVTITKNEAGQEGSGIYLWNGSHTVLINSIVWDNVNDEIFFSNEFKPNQATVAYSDIKNGQNGIATNNHGVINWLDGNITDNPLFVDTTDFDYQLKSGSPCIDKGTDFYMLNGDTLIDLDPTQYLGDKPDMGAFEFDPANPPVVVPRMINVPADQPTIQEAIDVAMDGDTVLVQPDTYNENIDFNGKNIIVGSLFLTTGDTSNISKTIIDGGQKATVVKFVNGENNSTMLSGFTIQNGKDITGKAAGGIFCHHSSCPRLENLIVRKNFTEHGHGAGIRCKNGSEPIIKNCLIIENQVTGSGDGGGLACTSSHPVLINVLIAHNQSYDGGAISCMSGSRPTCINVTCANNSATNEGGGIYLWYSSHITFINSIIWYNLPENVLFSREFDPDSISFIHTNLQGGTAGIIRHNNGTINWLNGNITDDPLFVNTSVLDYHLKPGSPCIDKGVDFYVTYGGDTLIDLDSTQYIGDKPDMGAFEFDPANPPIIPRMINVPADQPTIQQAIDIANPGDTVLVQPETYQENIDFKGKPITVASLALTTFDSSYTSNTIIDGNQKGPVVKFINGENAAAVLMGFTIQNGHNITSPGFGGGILCNQSSSPTLKYLNVKNNYSKQGGGIFCGSNSNPDIQYCMVIDNIAEGSGAGIYLFESSPRLENVLIANNSTNITGGGLYTASSDPLILNTTFFGNQGYSGGGAIYCSDHSLPMVFNSILWNNIPDEISFDTLSKPDTLFIDYSDIENSQSDVHANANGIIRWGANNIEDDPLFLNTDKNNFDLHWTSKCIDRGVHRYINESGDTLFIKNCMGTDPEIGAFEFDPLSLETEPWMIEVPADQPTIQEAINMAYQGDTVLVHPGTYIENIDCQSKSIVVASLFLTTGDTSYVSKTIIDGGQKDAVVKFGYSKQNPAALAGFTIQNGLDTTDIGFGGGVQCIGASNLSLSHLIIKNNVGYLGGGIGCFTSNPMIQDCIIYQNSATLGGGGVFLSESDAVLKNVLIAKNTSVHGGGICTILNSLLLIMNTTLTQNQSDSSGGAIQCANNAHMTFLNSILWDNSPNEVFVDQFNAPATITVEYTDIKGGELGIVHDGNGIYKWGLGNLDSDPLFMEPAAMNFGLQEGSPCIDKGIAFYTDDFGDTLLNLDPGDYTGLAPDMGAFELNPISDVTPRLNMPISFSLSQNYPNPFNPITTISYSIPEPADVELKVYNLSGRFVTTLVQQYTQPGYYTVVWNAKQYASGMYLIFLKAGTFKVFHKCCLIK